MDIVGFGQSDGFGYATLEWMENMKFELSNINQRSIKSTCKGSFYNYFFIVFTLGDTTYIAYTTYNCSNFIPNPT